MTQPTARGQGRAGTLQLEQTSAGPTLRPIGDWTLPHYSSLKQEIASLGEVKPVHIHWTEVQGLDTAGVALLAGLLGAGLLKAQAEATDELTPARRALVVAVAKTLISPRVIQPRPTLWPWEWLARLGAMVIHGWGEFLLLLGFTGLTLSTTARLLPHPHRWRLTAMVVQIHENGLDAMPIVALLTFMVGAVVAFLGATVLAHFGATVYTVDLVVYSFLREFGAMLAAILLAGRTASAYTAQLGSMKVNQEMDALRAQGLDPVELLVIPRMLALFISLPLLTIVAIFSGFAGGAAVATLSLDIPVSRIIEMVQQVPLRHYLVGLVKAPFFAIIIALIGCLEGFKVEGSARSVGAHTTSSVVQCICGVILLDALAAMFFMEMDW